MDEGDRCDFCGLAGQVCTCGVPVCAECGVVMADGIGAVYCDATDFDCGFWLCERCEREAL